MERTPFLLIYSRIALGLLIGIIALSRFENQAIWIVVLMSVGLITDILDGIIARRLHVSTEKMRVWDSNVDQFFWTVTILAIFYLNMAFIKNNVLWIGILILLELSSYLISYLKFKRPIATHTLLAKCWTLSLFWFLIDLIFHHTSKLPFVICIVLGIISRLEINLIVLNLKKWTPDVPSIFKVSKINKGIPFKKNRLFNS